MGAALVVLAATPMEMRAVLQGAGHAAPAPEPGRDARIRHGDVMFVVTGVGPLAAAFTLGSLAGEGMLDARRCRGIACFGVAGTYNAAAAPLGSVALATREIWPEYGLVTENGVDPEILGFPLDGAKGAASPPPVWNAMDLDPTAAFPAMGLRDPAARPPRPQAPHWVAGPSVTVAGVSGTPARAAALAHEHNALTENMEGFPVALAARRACLPFIQARAVSNIAGRRDANAWAMTPALEALSRAVAQLFAK